MSQRWTHDQAKDRQGHFYKSCSVWTDYNDGMPLKIATIYKNHERMPYAEYEANIRLITSAPAMYDLLSVLCKDGAVVRATHEAFAARDKARELLLSIAGYEK